MSASRAADSAAAGDGDGDDCLDFLIAPFTRALTGEDGYVTVLLEIRARNLLDEAAWWTAVDDLRNGGHLAADRYGQLLDELHARGLLNDLGYRRQRGHYPPAPSHEPFPRVPNPMRTATGAFPQRTAKRICSSRFEWVRDETGNELTAAANEGREHPRASRTVLPGE